MTEENGFFDWSVFVSRLVHPTKVTAIEAMLWIGRPLSATELEKIASANPVLSEFSHHLNTLIDMGLMERVAKCKSRRAQSSKPETFVFFAGQHQWAEKIVRQSDPSDPLADVAAKHLIMLGLDPKGSYKVETLA